MTGSDVRPEGAPLRLALVDDTSDIRDLLRRAFERTQRFQVVAEAGNGQEAVEVSAAHDPDVVLLDISMPVMDGLEALPLVRQACPRATVVMLSAFGAAEMSQRAMALGADGYIQKGTSMSSVVASVEDLVGRTRPGWSPAPA